MSTRLVAKDATERPLPHNLDAERSLLGAILLDNYTLNTAVERLKPEDFFLDQHRLIFQHMSAMADTQQAVDLVTLVDHLRNAGQLEAAGGAGFVAQLVDGVPRVTNVEHYARIVKEKALLRNLIYRADAIQQEALEAGEGADAILARAADALSDLQAAGRTTGERAKIVTATELPAMKIEPREPLLDGLIMGRSLNEIFSWRGLGKTWLTLGASHAIATGTQFLKWKAPRARPLLFVDGELDAQSLQQRVRDLDCAASCSSADRFRILSCDLQDDPFPNLATRRAQMLIEDGLEDSELLVLDNLSALAPSSNEHEAEDWIQIQSWLLDLRKRGVASIFLHHAGHSGWARGTTRREDLLDLVLELRRPKDYVASEGLRFEIHFTKTRGMLGAGAEPIEARLGTDFEGHAQWSWRSLEDLRAKQVIEMRQAGNSFREIESLTGIPRATAERLSRKAASQ